MSPSRLEALCFAGVVPTTEVVPDVGDSDATAGAPDGSWALNRRRWKKAVDGALVVSVPVLDTIYDDSIIVLRLRQPKGSTSFSYPQINPFTLLLFSKVLFSMDILF